ncbi:hypothetical protein DFH09DRAFT_1191798 [Mycena vulgaris]|nr:hypothetical protein DFH09DRAFT_1191798 [Mycena vulgaris]
MRLDTTSRTRLPRRAILAIACLAALTLLHTAVHSRTRQPLIPHQCRSLRTPLDPAPGFTATRTATGSDRFVPGTRATLIKNAKVLTGARNGTEVIYGDVLLDKGVVIAVGYIPEHLALPEDLDVLDAEGKWISPGLVDAHSHLGLSPAPGLSGAKDGNSRRGPILPWLRAIDAINTHDDAYRLAVAGGVTTAQVVPGSGNNIGGQAFLIKLRPTAERSTSSMILEPPHTLLLNGTDARPRWRHMKCENPDRNYGQTRMDAAWAFRQAYRAARKIRDAQDAFCARAEAGAWDGKSAFPEDLKWEALVDVLRGRVKLSVHCYEAVDLDALVRLSNEFQFPIASIHHAGETYLVPDLLKRAWGNLPAIALFASNFRKKREAYRGSEFAPRILADNGLPVIMKSDHPVLNSRYLMYEAQQAHYHSLNPGIAIAAVTSTPANALGIGWRVGSIAEDLVLWDSHPLALGATPLQVFIDGIPQLKNPSSSLKPDAFQHVPRTPSWEREVQDTIKYEGLPPLAGTPVKGTVAFVGVRGVWVRRGDGVQPLDGAGEMESNMTIACAGAYAAGACAAFLDGEVEVAEIILEASTTDGPVFDPLTMVVPSILGDSVVRAVDGLQFGGRNTLYAYRAGVTTAVVAPMGNGFLQGVATAFDVGAPNALAAGAIVQEETSLHISLHSGMLASPWLRVRKGEIPLVIAVHNADIMAALLRLKHEYETSSYHNLWMTFTGASEAHLLAAKIGAAGVSVILSPARPYPSNWDSRRILPGPPLSRDTATTMLLKHGVNVGLGVNADHDARSARFEMAWASLDSNGTIDYPTAIALSSTNIEKALGLKHRARDADELVVFLGGGALDIEKFFFFDIIIYSPIPHRTPGDS